MSHIIADGFDDYGVKTEAVGLWTSLGGMNLSAVTRFGVGQSVVSSTSLGVTGWVTPFGQNASTIFLTFAHTQVSAVAGSTRSLALRIMDGTTVQCTIDFNNNGNLEFYRGDGAALLGTYIGAFNGSSNWAHFQIKIVLSNTVGSFEVRKNGSAVNNFTLSGVDNVNSANEFANATDNLTRSNFDMFAQTFDDLWIYSGAVVAGEPSDWIGDVRAIQVVPTSDSTVQLSRSAGATNFSNVDELINSGADYVFSSTAGQVDQYGNAGLASPPAAILLAQFREKAFKMDAGPRTVGLRVTSGATVSDSPGVAVGIAAQTVHYNLFRNPDTEAAWTAAEVAAMLHGPRIVT